MQSMSVKTIIYGILIERLLFGIFLMGNKNFNMVISKIASHSLNRIIHQEV